MKNHAYKKLISSIKEDKEIEKQKERILIGYIYVLSNPAMQGLLKIGFTENEVQERVSELSMNTAVPLPFVIEHEEFVENPRKCEKQIHKALSKYRLSKDREFFKIELDKSLKVIRKIIYGTEDFTEATMGSVKNRVLIMKKYPEKFTYDPQKNQKIALLMKQIL